MSPEIKAAFTKLTPKAVAVLGELLDSDDDRVRVMAANAILDRTFGKPVQAVDAKVEQNNGIAAAHLKALREINERRDARLDAERRMADAKVIDLAAASDDSSKEPE
jgi:hypothetical protein